MESNDDLPLFDDQETEDHKQHSFLWLWGLYGGMPDVFKQLQDELRDENRPKTIGDTYFPLYGGMP